MRQNLFVRHAPIQFLPDLFNNISLGELFIFVEWKIVYLLNENYVSIETNCESIEWKIM